MKNQLASLAKLFILVNLLVLALWSMPEQSFACEVHPVSKDMVNAEI